MESFRNKRIIQQGETWYLDLLLSQSVTEYIPYILSRNLDNPHFVITVASTKYEKNNRYVESWWLDCDNELHIPRFEQTVPQYIGELSEHPNTLGDIPSGLTPGIKNASGTYDPGYTCLYQYKYVGTGDDYGKMFYVYYVQEVPNDTTILQKDYECRITFSLTLGQSDGQWSNGTGDWVSQNYQYQITLVSGQLMTDKLIEAKNSYPELDWRTDWPNENDYESQTEYRAAVNLWLQQTSEKGRPVQEEVFYFIKNRIPNYFQSDIDWDSPLGKIWTPEPILTPTDLQVNNNLRVII